MEPMNQGGAAAAPARHVTPGELEALFTSEYRKLVKLLTILGATIEEAEDAVQNAFADLAKPPSPARPPIRSPAAWVRTAAIRFFIKKRQRERVGRQREIDGHLPLGESVADDELTAHEDEQWVEHVLQTLTPAQRDVFRLVMEGAPTREIAEILSKKVATIRQHEKNARDCLRKHPEIVVRALRAPQARAPAATETQSEATAAPGEEAQ
jgi:RNA polymerase sigma factor (sigma-70 family)